MNEMLIIDAIHILTFSWSMSKFVSSQNAWKNLYVDIPSHFLAASTWIIMVTSSIVSANEVSKGVSKMPLVTLMLIVMIAIILVLLVYLFVQLREFLGE